MARKTTCLGLTWVVTVFALTACNPSNIAVPVGPAHTTAVVRAIPDIPGGAGATDNFVNVSVMMPGRCFAGSPIDTKAAGGFWKSDNDAKPVSVSCTGTGLYLLAEPEHAMRLDKQPGMRLVLVNQTSQALAFAASDSRLPIVQEARDATGAWRPVEYLVPSDCGNSYHRVFLEPGHFWEFPVPRYQGAMKTELRFAMLLNEHFTLYSNSFEGSINPGQFSERE